MSVCVCMFVPRVWFTQHISNTISFSHKISIRQRPQLLLPLLPARATATTTININLLCCAAAAAAASACARFISFCEAYSTRVIQREKAKRASPFSSFLLLSQLHNCVVFSSYFFFVWLVPFRCFVLLYICRCRLLHFSLNILSLHQAWGLPDGSCKISSLFLFLSLKINTFLGIFSILFRISVNS